MTEPVVATRAGGEVRRHGVRLAALRLGQAISWLVIVAVVGALAVAVLIPRIGGATPYTILTGSMRPHYPPGTLVVVKPVAPQAIGIGSVVTYQRQSGKPEVVTHRVVQVGQDAHGAPQWRTEGDANSALDPGWIRPVQIKGRLWYSVPQMGRLNLLITGHQRQSAVYVVALGLFGYAAAMWLGAVVGRFRRRDPTGQVLA
jgi:signal peptidase